MADLSAPWIMEQDVDMSTNIHLERALLDYLNKHTEIPSEDVEGFGDIIALANHMNTDTHKVILRMTIIEKSK